jgi:hypothetical protein
VEQEGSKDGKRDDCWKSGVTVCTTITGNISMQCRSWSFPHFFMQPQQQQQQAAGAASGASGGAGKIKYRVDVEKNVVVANCERRGWIQTTGNDWNLYWANVSSVKQLFNPEAGQRLTGACRTCATPWSSYLLHMFIDAATSCTAIVQIISS